MGYIIKDKRPYTTGITSKPTTQKTSSYVARGSGRNESYIKKTPATVKSPSFVMVGDKKGGQVARQTGVKFVAGSAGGKTPAGQMTSGYYIFRQPGSLDVESPEKGSMPMGSYANAGYGGSSAPGMFGGGFMGGGGRQMYGGGSLPPPSNPNAISSKIEEAEDVLGSFFKDLNNGTKGLSRNMLLLLIAIIIGIGLIIGGTEK